MQSSTSCVGFREAGASIARLAAMWHISTTTVHQILAAQRVKFGPEQLPKEKGNMPASIYSTSGNSEPTSTRS